MGAIPQLSVADLATHLAAGDVHLLDVRSGAEWREGHISSALHVPLGYLTAHLADVPSDRPVVVQCRSGSRSAITASLLRRLGRREVVNLAGGIDAWRAAGRPVSDSRDVAAPAADGGGRRRPGRPRPGLRLRQQRLSADEGHRTASPATACAEPSLSRPLAGHALVVVLGAQALEQLDGLGIGLHALHRPVGHVHRGLPAAIQHRDVAALGHEIRDHRVVAA